MIVNWLLLLGMAVCSVGAFGSALVARRLKSKQQPLPLAVKGLGRDITATLPSTSATAIFGRPEIRTYAESAHRLEDFRAEGGQNTQVLIRPIRPQTA